MARNPFKVRQLAQMFDACLLTASDNFSEFYFGDGRTPYGPRFPRTGAGHRVAFWDAFFGRPSLSDGTRGGKGTLQYAAFRAGLAFRAGARALPWSQ